jgi:hypothetical protein
MHSLTLLRIASSMKNRRRRRHPHHLYCDAGVEVVPVDESRPPLTELLQALQIRRE